MGSLHKASVKRHNKLILWKLIVHGTVVLKVDHTPGGTFKTHCSTPDLYPQSYFVGMWSEAGVIHIS